MSGSKALEDIKHQRAKAALIQQQAEERARKAVELEMKRVELEIKRTGLDPQLTPIHTKA